ncbi:MAG: RNA-binding protein [Nitrospirota bacterium]|nr:RNA-binding protein [Nitrospirota bacterium]
MNLFVGNLSFDTSDQDLREAFSAYGQVSSAAVIMDRDSGRSRGFGFVEMPSDAEARAAIEGLNDKELHGRRVSVNEARPRASRGGGGDRGGDRGGRRGGY